MSGSYVSRAEVQALIDEALDRQRVLISQLQGAAPAFVGVGSAPAFSAGWGNYPTGYAHVSYWRSGRTVFLSGLASKTGGTPGSGDVIFVLPVGFRPVTSEVFSAATGEATTFGRVDVDPAGQVIWRSGAGAETDFTSLSGISFWAA